MTLEEKDVEAQIAKTDAKCKTCGKEYVWWAGPACTCSGFPRTDASLTDNDGQLAALPDAAPRPGHPRRCENGDRYDPKDGPVVVTIRYFKPTSGKWYCNDEDVTWAPDPDHYTGWRAFKDLVRLKDMTAVCIDSPLGVPQSAPGDLSKWGDPVQKTEPVRTYRDGYKAAIDEACKCVALFLGHDQDSEDLTLAIKTSVHVEDEIEPAAGTASALPRRQPIERLPLTHVACRDTEGRIWSLPRPFRHHHVLAVMRLHETRCAEDNHFSQGFLDANGRYLHRKSAWVNADLNGQIKGGKIIGGVLTSEDLW